MTHKKRHFKTNKVETIQNQSKELEIEMNISFDHFVKQNSFVFSQKRGAFMNKVKNEVFL